MEQINLKTLFEISKGIFFVVLAGLLSLVVFSLCDENNITNVYIIISLYVIVFLVLFFFTIHVFKITFEYSSLFLVGFIIFSIPIIFNNDSKKNGNDMNTTLKQHSIFQTEEQMNNYKYANIENKIIILKNMGLNTEKIFDRLKNNMEFRELIKGGNDKFNEIYNGVENTSQDSAQ
ncbi:hypothetical protein [Sulfurimonas sp.]|uniref:hypothetical protein n=1 Tax=Sulfurimonas sp. TaxID=2022749 RepID=UPI002AB3125E|nr:hypothetical protein [Sulfurimonas sp.]